jgi:hypothetical protein
MGPEKGPSPEIPWWSMERTIRIRGNIRKGPWYILRLRFCPGQRRNRVRVSFIAKVMEDPETAVLRPVRAKNCGKSVILSPSQ